MYEKLFKKLIIQRWVIKNIKYILKTYTYLTLIEELYTYYDLIVNI